MALFKESDLRARAARGTSLQKSAATVLNERMFDSVSRSGFDIFLSHSFDDQNIILGILLSLEDMGYKVYVDWIIDRHLSRDKVSKETAEVLRGRMLSSKSLFFATTDSSSSSKWMPWELGFMDGHNRKAAILPIIQSTTTDRYSGQEYLGIYPYVTVDAAVGAPEKRLWIRTSGTCYVLFDSWLSGKQPVERT